MDDANQLAAQLAHLMELVEKHRREGQELQRQAAELIARLERLRDHSTGGVAPTQPARLAPPRFPPLADAAE